MTNICANECIRSNNLHKVEAFAIYVNSLKELPLNKFNTLNKIFTYSIDATRTKKYTFYNILKLFILIKSNLNNLLQPISSPVHIALTAVAYDLLSNKIIMRLLTILIQNDQQVDALLADPGIVGVIQLKPSGTLRRRLARSGN